MKTIWVIMRDYGRGELGQPVAAFSDESRAHTEAKKLWPRPRDGYEVVEIHLDPPGVPS